MIRRAGWIVIFALSSAAWANSGGAPPQVTGAPGEGTCTACHGGTANSGPGSLQIRFDGATNWAPGQPVKVKLTLADPNAARWGFQLTARAASNPNQTAGSFRIIEDTTRFATGAPAGTEYVTHTLTGTRPGTTGSVSWEVEWTPPSNAGFGDVIFYAAGNAANGNGQADLGDRIYTTTFTASPGTPATGLVRVLPQLAFGDVWSTTVYLHNTSGAPVQAAVRFYDTGGAPLTVPGLNASSVTLNLGPRGTGVVEAPRLGPLTQGSIAVEAPAEVIGYGIFRQEQPNVNPQEGVVPLSSSTSTGATIVYDDTATFVTSVAVLNPGSTPVTVTVVARDDTGAQTGTLTLNLNARERVAFEVRNRPELAMVQGRRGVLEFSSAGGPVAVLGLRFNGFALTSILPVEQ
ncbi:MAG: Reeler domain-containing protein [Bryobacteraceae bacterium]